MPLLPKYLTDHEEVKLLILKIEQDLLNQSELKDMLLAAGATLAMHRKDLDAVTTRLMLTRAPRRARLMRRQSALAADKSSLS